MLPQRTVSAAARRQWLIIGYVAGALVVAGIWTATAQGWLPLFFVQGQGGTPLRNLVLTSSVGMFVIASGAMWSRREGSRLQFFTWYSVGLSLVAVGAIGLLVQTVHGSVLGWVGRSAQYLGGAYIVIGAFLSVRDARTWELAIPVKRREEALFRRAIRSAVVTPLAAISVIAFVLSGALFYLFDSAQRVERTREVLTDVAEMERLFVDSETGLRGYEITSSKVFLEPLEKAEGAIPGKLRLVESLLEEDAEQLLLLKEARDLYRVWKEFAVEVRQRVEAHTPRNASLQLRGKELMVGIRVRLGRLQEEEHRLLLSRSRRVGSAKSIVFSAMLFSAFVFAPVLMGSVRRALSSATASYREALVRIEKEQERLRAREEELEEAQCLAHVGSWTWNEMSDAATGSRELYRVFGISTPEFPDFNDQKGRLYPEESWTKLRQAMWASLQTYRGFELDLEALRNGERIWITVRSEVSRNGQGEVVGLRGTIQDISARKKSEEEVRRATSIFRAIGDNSADLIYVKDTESRMLYANPATCRAIGKSSLELLGRNELAWGGDTEEMRTIMRNDRCVLESRRNHQTEEVFTGSDGVARVYHSSKVCWYDANGEPLGIIGISRDITERKQIEEELRTSEERLRLAAQTSGFGVHDYDLQQNRAIWSPELYKITGLPEGQEVCLNTALELIHPCDRERVVISMKRALDPTGPGFFAEEFCLLRADTRETRWVYNRCQTIFRETGEGRKAQRNTGIVLDITERKRREELLLEQTRLLSLTNDAISVRNAEDCITYWNKGATELYGYSEEEALGQSHNELLKTELPEPESLVRATLEHENRWTGEVVQRRKDGKKIFVEARWALDRDEHGKWRSILETGNDITQRRQDEARLRESEERFRNLADETPVFIWVADENINVTYANRTFLNFMDLKEPKELDGRAWESCVHPEDVAVVHKTYGNAVRERKPYTLEVRCRVPSTGEYEWVFFKGVPRSVGERFAGFIGTGVNINEAKVAEASLREMSELFQTLADNISPLAWMANADGSVFWYNKQWFDYTGTTLEEMQSANPEKFLHPEHAQRVISRWKEQLEKGEAWEDTFPLRGADGRFRWFLSRARPIYDEGGKLVRFFGTNVDVTDLREAQAALSVANEQLSSRAKQLEVLVQQRTEKLQETISELEAFSYSISHDMRAPLRTMQGFARILVTEYSSQIDEEGRGLLARIEKASLRLDLLVQDVLAYSKVAKGRHIMEPVALDPLVSEVIQQYGFSDQADFEVVGDLPTVLGHQALLSQVFSNLVGNAIKFVRPGVRSQVSIRANVSGEKVRVSIEDNGIGIAPEHQERIFEIFGRVHSQKEYEGTGIGLAVVKKAVERMGGELGVDSELGKGSCFWFVLRRVSHLTERPLGPDLLSCSESSDRQDSGPELTRAASEG